MYYLTLREKRRCQTAGVWPQLLDTAGVRDVLEALGAQRRLRERLPPSDPRTQQSGGRGQHKHPEPAETPQSTCMEASLYF